MNVDLSQGEKVNLLVSLCPKMGLSADEILSMYLVLGDRIFFLFDLLHEKSIKFPSMRSFHHGVSYANSFWVKKLTKSHYAVNGVDSYCNDIKRGDLVKVEGEELEALGSPIEVFGEIYLMVRSKK